MSHTCLIKKLHSIGIRGSLLKWFNSYLTDRRHRTVIEGHASPWLPVKSGVPQGSILGPLLFVIYVNDLPKVVDDGTTVQIYADDTKCYRTISDQSDMIQLQQDIHNLEKWSVVHRMLFKVEKCKHLRVTRKRKAITGSYTVNGIPISEVSNEKDLGVMISGDLSWNSHVGRVVNNANKMLGLICRTCRNDCDQRTMLTLYRNLVRPQLEYATQAWSPSGVGNIKKVERVQRRATRFILKSSDDYPERLRKLGLLPLQYRREILDLCFLFKCLNGHYDFDIFKFVNFKDFKYTIRNSELILTRNHARTNIFLYSYFNRIVNLWNNLPEATRTNKVYSSFKTLITKYYHTMFSLNAKDFA